MEICKHEWFPKVTSINLSTSAMKTRRAHSSFWWFSYYIRCALRVRTKDRDALFFLHSHPLAPSPLLEHLLSVSKGPFSSVSILHLNPDGPRDCYAGIINIRLLILRLGHPTRSSRSSLLSGMGELGEFDELNARLLYSNNLIARRYFRLRVLELEAWRWRFFVPLVSQLRRAGSYFWNSILAALEVSIITNHTLRSWVSSVSSCWNPSTRSARINTKYYLLDASQSKDIAKRRSAWIRRVDRTSSRMVQSRPSCGMKVFLG